MGKRQGEETLRRRRARVRDIPFPPFLGCERNELKHNRVYRRLRRTLRYYEWLKKGSQRIPHYTRHKDQRLMLFAGLYDSVTLEGELPASMGGGVQESIFDLLMAGGGRRSVRATLDIHDRYDGGK